MVARPSDIAAQIKSDSWWISVLTIALVVASSVVLVGLAWEDWADLKKLKAIVQRYFSDRALARERPDLGDAQRLNRDERKRLSKKLLPAAIVVFGIAAELFLQFWASRVESDLETEYGTEITDASNRADISDQKAINALNAAADASTRADASNERAVRLLKIESDRHVIVYSDAFDKLRTFKNISIWVNIAGLTLKTLRDNNLDQGLRPQIFQELEEKDRFASTFNILKAVGWNITVLSPNDPHAVYMPAGPDSDAVTVYSRGPEDVWQCDDDPYAIATNTPEMTECAAAGALAKYLSAIGAGPVRHWSVGKGMFLPKNMPSDAILVMVGAHNIPEALEEEERSIESTEWERRREEAIHGTKSP